MIGSPIFSCFLYNSIRVTCAEFRSDVHRRLVSVHPTNADEWRSGRAFGFVVKIRELFCAHGEHEVVFQDLIGQVVAVSAASALHGIWSGSGAVFVSSSASMPKHPGLMRPWVRSCAVTLLSIAQLSGIYGGFPREQSAAQLVFAAGWPRARLSGSILA